MMRIAWKMRLKPGGEEVYERTHREMSAEMSDRIRSSGVHNFSIFRHDLELFAYLELPEGAEVPSDPDPEDAVMWTWWRRLEPYMECEPSAKPLMWPLLEVWHQD
jgi:L-rhamnose mutarotase